MVSREAINTALAALENDRGRLTPIMVVDAARDPKSELHGAFEWDDTKAAAEHRLNTARRLLTVHVKVMDVISPDE